MPVLSEYLTIVADPPWKFGDSLPGASRGASKNYGCLSVAEIVLLLHPYTSDDSRLFLWRVASMQEEALDVCRRLGYTVKSELVWKKLTVNGNRWFGMGRQVRMEHEVCLIATRGKPAPVLDRSVRSVFEAPYGGHSTKPDAFYELVERLSPGPYVDCFARRARPGWTAWGDELVIPALDVSGSAAL